MASRSAPIPRTGLGYWLVKTGMGQSEVQQFPSGQSPPQARFGTAIYLGPTATDAARFTSDAARRLGVPNPQNIPTLSTSVGILGSILGGFGAGAAGAAAVAGDTAAVAAGTDTAATAAAGTGTTAAGTAASTATKAAKTGGSLFTRTAGSIHSTVDFLAFIAFIFHPRNILRAVEFLVGVALMFFGMQAAMQARGERIEGFSTSEGAITRSGLGRVATELGRATRSGERAQRPRSAPHRTRQRALQQRYRREEDLQRRRAKSPRPRKRP